ncbi:bifunctional protein [Phaffia rhodozyma]|uniref:Folylpolyglutamate synthase n=1 Tax=Phaffia rhodozyma TaxID=264483 RepID=A0A0F7SRL7_PHARH|nr:bifunctional protein [Phaffia rhodozyma]
MSLSTRAYRDAIHLLNSLQSNAATIAAIKASGGKMNESALVEMREYLGRVGYQPTRLNALNAIHITGTKGKGSTSAFCDSVLRSLYAAHEPLDKKIKRPLKVGLYTSPHLVAVRERIRINGVPLSEELFAKYFFEVWERLEGNTQIANPLTPVKPVYFRYLTLLAFHAFLSEKVDTSIFEVGIGGAFDSTNIIPQPVVAGVTSLGLDHTHLLGDTIGKVAWNKGGIYKQGVPAFSVQQPENGEEVLRARADEAHASSFVVLPNRPELALIKLGLAGIHQRTNATLSLSLVDSLLKSPSLSPSSPLYGVSSPSLEGPLDQPTKEGLENTSWPGRCQILQAGQIRTFLDGAHTTESLEGCGNWFWEEVKERTEGGRRRVLVFNCTNGRSASSLLTALLSQARRLSGTSSSVPLFDKVIFSTNTTYASGQSKGDLQSSVEDQTLEIQESLASAFREIEPSFPPDAIRITSSIQEAFELVCSETKEQSTENEVDVLVTGSLHLVGGWMEVAGLVEVGLTV